MDERATCQCECGATANMVITPVRFDWQKMGLDPDFATFSDKWANIQTRKNTGLTRTQNETYGGLDTDKIRHENKQKFTG